MAATFDQLFNELMGHIPLMSPILAPKLVNRAWRDINDHRLWNFNITDAWLFSPAIINTGSANVTKFSASVTMNAAASTALTGLSNPVLTKRQIRFAGGPIYSITAVNTSNPSAYVLTLDRIYLETTNTAQSYVVSRIFYGPPLDATGIEVTDFLRYKMVYDPVSAYSFFLNATSDEVDISDPQRASSGQPYVLATRKMDSSDQPVYEMWPSPNFERGYLVKYQMRGIDLVSGNTLPPVISDELLLSRALWLACQWALIQTDPRLKGINWRYAMEMHNARFRELLQIAEKQDSEQQQTNLIVPEGQGFFPIDSAFAQSHAFPLG